MASCSVAAAHVDTRPLGENGRILLQEHSACVIIETILGAVFFCRRNFWSSLNSTTRFILDTGFWHWKRWSTVSTSCQKGQVLLVERFHCWSLCATGIWPVASFVIPMETNLRWPLTPRSIPSHQTVSDVASDQARRFCQYAKATLAESLLWRLRRLRLVNRSPWKEAKRSFLGHVGRLIRIPLSLARFQACFASLLA